LVLNIRPLFVAEFVELGGDFFSEEVFDLLYAFILLAHGLFGFVFTLFEHARPGSFFYHAQNFLGPHVKDL